MNGFKSFIKWLIVSLVVLVAVLGIGLVVAQTAHAAPAVPALGPVVQQTGDPTMDQSLADALKAIILAISGLVLVPGFAPLTTLITNILKRYLPSTIGGEYIHLAIATVIFLGFAVATKFGMGTQFTAGCSLRLRRRLARTGSAPRARAQRRPCP